MAALRWRGPDVLVVGWIPFHIHPPPAPGFPVGLGTSLLFWSGNPVPPIAFAGYAGFANWLHPKNPIGTKEYRAAIYLEGVAAEFPDDESPPRADRTANGSFIGYTPLRLFVGGANVAATLPQVAQYLKGTGPLSAPPAATPDPAGNWVELRYRAEFKLSGLPNVISRAITGAWAPYAWCEIAYRFDRAGQVGVRVDGSAIPSQRLYVNWTTPAGNAAAGISAEHDMLTANPAAVTGFLQTAGWGCRPAPVGSQLTWRGPASPW